MGSFLIAITIYISLIAYLLATLLWVSGRQAATYRLFWTLGCGFLWVHAACAFHFYHRWSHADAVRLTAEQTKAIIGFEYGNGIWFSYLLLLVWMVDVIRLWRMDFLKSRAADSLSAAASSISSTEVLSNPSWVGSIFSYIVHAYAFFILFNGTVVFKEGAVRWGGIVGTLWIIQMVWRFRVRRPAWMLSNMNANLKAKS